MTDGTELDAAVAADETITAGMPSRTGARSIAIRGARTPLRLSIREIASPIHQCSWSRRPTSEVRRVRCLRSATFRATRLERVVLLGRP